MKFVESSKIFWFSIKFCWIFCNVLNFSWNWLDLQLISLIFWEHSDFHLKFLWISKTILISDIRMDFNFMKIPNISSWYSIWFVLLQNFKLISTFIFPLNLLSIHQTEDKSNQGFQSKKNLFFLFKEIRILFLLLSNAFACPWIIVRRD